MGNLSLGGKWPLFAKGCVSMQGSMLTVSAVGAAVAVIAELADYRRRHRHDVDAVGFMPWRGIALTAVTVALFAAAFALKP